MVGGPPVIVRPFVAAALLALLPPVAPADPGSARTADPAAGVAQHFHPKGKAPSKYTIELQDGQRATLPFEDRRDFEEAKRGFVAAPAYRQIMAEAGNVAWDMGSYDFLLGDEQFDSVHPSLQRLAVLNMAYGLYEVVPGRIWQVRGFDLANISFVKGDTGWIVFDVLTAKETAAAALELVNDTLGARPVVAVVYSHSHADHFGGIRGIVDEADVRSGKVPIIAPVGFMEHAIAENVYAGNAMTRRLFYQYGILLPRSPFGHVDQSIGKNVATGNLGLIAPTRTIEKDIEEVTIDGVTMVFQNTPGTEAPAEMNTWFPQFKAFWAAENITGTIHNIYTLRGALVRDALEWSKKINEALYLFGQDAEVMFASHSWPRWGNERIQEVMRAQRDLYANLNNEVLHLANQGVTINEVHNVYAPPKSLQRQWAAHSYHGSEAHNSRAVLNRYLGYWDANPATLIPLSPRDSAPLYVEMMGGAAKIMAKEIPPRAGDPQQARVCRARQPGGQGPAGGRVRADRLPAGKPQRAQQLPGRGAGVALGRAGRHHAEGDGPGPDPGHDHRPLARLPRHPPRQPQGGGAALHHQPGDPGQWRAFCDRAQQRDADQHQGAAGPQRGPDDHRRPRRPRAGDDAAGHVPAAGRRRQGEVRGRPGRVRPAAGHAGAVRPGLRDPAGHEGGRQSPVGTGRRGPGE
jgi:hypothetical protein